VAPVFEAAVAAPAKEEEDEEEIEEAVTCED
jgi:hypothetical protein